MDHQQFGLNLALPPECRVSAPPVRVKSFDIDFVAKKVSVFGDVAPLEVLSSISKVKNAQLCPPTLSSSPSPLNFTIPELSYKGAAVA
ncbi:SODIUM POTASSIUM ROOT DEFECTIVE 2-like [Olea europaea subsp. europaea]|uniref:SODIUM POTASSIUM ROOT DEFECTIVE 2-like n=1 Tax=Olea europaea subsp. europaea TaxID=158383 RepID=A0A8S0S411_OLEEU|nr:SODIUM POTASSIUM ROOT DEFECTIVE 2-like [Olea europaea subsp. europaea]